MRSKWKPKDPEIVKEPTNPVAKSVTAIDIVMEDTEKATSKPSHGTPDHLNGSTKDTTSKDDSDMADEEIPPDAGEILEANKVNKSNSENIKPKEL